MSAPVRLPDFIEVANIRDLFWNNNSDLYPTCVPTEYVTLVKTRPTFLSPYVGTCVLDGEYNHCLYNGTYYFLTKLEVLDMEIPRYRYQLDYDVMINFIFRGVAVKGTLVKTNREDILEGCLQTTVPILADPIEKLSFSDKDSDHKLTWQQKLKIISPNIDIFKEGSAELTISKQAVDAFIYRVENNILANKCKDKEWLPFNKNLDWYYNVFKHRNPLFLLDVLKPKRYVSEWKVGILAKLYSIVLINKNSLVITKQTEPSDHFNVGQYVLGVKDKTLGKNIASEVFINTLDLSQCIDIVPIDYKTKNRIDPIKKRTYDTLPTDGKLDLNSPPIHVLLRKPYLPLGNNKSIEGCIPKEGPYMMDFCQLGLLNGSNTPQKLELKTGNIGYLWYLNRHNVGIVENTSENIKELFNLKVSSTNDFGQRYWGFVYADYDKLPPIGFLIFQIRQHIHEWRDFEYLGANNQNIYIRTGLLRSKVSEKYINKAEDNWWGEADDILLDLWGDHTIGKIMLDLDQFNWLAIAPSETPYNYKYHGYDRANWGYTRSNKGYWGYKKFFSKAGDLEWNFPASLNRRNIEFRGKEISCPYSYYRTQVNTSLPNFTIARQQSLDDISIYDGVLTLYINTNDLVIPLTEYGWYRGDWIYYHIPYQISTSDYMGWIKSDSKKIFSLDSAWLNEIQEDVTAIRAAGYGTLAATIIAWIAVPFTAGATLPVAAAGSAISTGLIYAGEEFNAKLDAGKYDHRGLIDWVAYTNPTDLKELRGDILDSGSIVFYLYRGEYRLGRYVIHEIDVPLSINPDNLIKSVNDQTSITLDIDHIRPLEEGKLDFNNQKVISDNLKQTIIDLVGGTISQTSTPTLHHYSNEDLKVGTHTFDLVNTDWYLVIHNGDYNLVPKHNGVFDTIKDEGGIITIDKPLSTYAKINQKANLNFYGQNYNLNTKFSTNRGVKYSSKPIVPDVKYADPDVEYRWLQVDEENDNIDVIVTLPRKESRAAEKVDAAQVLMMKERLMQLNMNYEQDKYANELMLGDKRLNMSRQREDLDWQYNSAAWNIGLKTAGIALGAGVGMTKGASVPYAAIGALGSAFSMKSDIEFLIRYPTLMKRINEDERNLLLANSQQLYQRKQNYEHDFKFQTLKLNKVAGTYQKSGVSNRDVQERYNKENANSNVFIEMFVPSQPQQTLINHIYSTYGCECISDYFISKPLMIENNMDGGIYKFSKIEKGGIQSSITDTMLRGILIQILENGVKFYDCKFDVVHTKPTIIPKIPKSTDLELAYKRLKELTEKVNELEDTVTECRKNETSLKDQIKSLQDHITSNSELCDRKIGELNKEKETIQQQLTQCQQQHTDIGKEKEKKEGEIQVIQGKVTALEVEKQELQNSLNECQKQIERLLAAQATCDRINTAEIKRLKDEIDSWKRQAQRNRIQFLTVNQQLTKSTEALTKAQNDLNTCNITLNTKTREIESLQKQLSEKQTQLNELLKAPKQSEELEKLKADLERETEAATAAMNSLAAKTKELKELKERLEGEIHQHKVDKEELEQKLNDERRRAINEKDEINRLKKQIEDTKGDRDKIAELEEKIQEIELEKATARDQIAAKQRELEQCRTELDIVKKDQPKGEGKPKIEEECGLIKQLLHDPYTYDLKPRENGWNAFLDLVFELAQLLRWEGRSGIDQKLSRVPELKVLLERLEELKNVPIIDKAIDTMNERGWTKYLDWLNKGGNVNGEVDKVIAKINSIKDLETQTNVHSIKAIVDELNWLSYQAKEGLTEQLKTNEDIQTFFSHIYPGSKTLDLYKVLYGDPNTAIIRKKFTEEIKCKPEEQSPIELLDSLRKTVKFDKADTPKPQPQPQPQTPPRKRPDRVRISAGLDIYLGDSSLTRLPRNLISNFNDAVRGTRASSNHPDWEWIIWNYPYRRYLKRNMSGSSISCPWNSDGYYRLVWVKHKWNNKTVDNQYFAIKSEGKPIAVDEIVTNVEQLWNQKSQMTVKRTLLNDIREGNVDIEINLNLIPTAVYELTNVSFALNTDTIQDIHSMGYLEDLIKMLSILHVNKIEWKDEYLDYTDSYKVYTFTQTLMSGDPYKRRLPWIFGEIGRGETPYVKERNKIIFNIGWIVPSEEYKNEQGRFCTVRNTCERNPQRYDHSTLYYRFLRWFLEVVSYKRPMEHPWKIDGGGAYAFLDALNKIATT